MEGFTTAFFLQLVITVGSAGAIYGAMRSELKNLGRSVDDERRLREMHQAADDITHHDIRNAIGSVSTRLATIEGSQRRHS